MSFKFLNQWIIIFKKTVNVYLCIYFLCKYVKNSVNELKNYFHLYETSFSSEIIFNNIF